MSLRFSSSVLPLMFLVGVYYFLQGMGGNPGLHSQALDFFLKDTLGLTPPEQASFLFMATIPWMIKPLYGVISDSVPIFRYRRASYFILGSLLSVMAYTAVHFLGYDYQSVLVLYIIGAVGFAFSDVLCDAVMVEKGQPLNATDKLQSAQWAAIGVSGIIISFAGGYIAELFTLQQAVLFSIVFPVAVILLTIFFLKEKRVISIGDSASKTWVGVKESLKMKKIWGCAVFIFLWHLSPSLGTSLYNYQIDILKFTQIDIGYLRTMGSVGFFAGALVFAGICQRLSERVLFPSIIILGTFTTLAYLFYKDFVSASVIDASMSFIGVVYFLGILTVAAKVCPKNAEGTVFALLMAVSNFGSQIGNVLGSELYSRVGFTWLVLISSSVTFSLFLFIPLMRSKPVSKIYIWICASVALSSVVLFFFRSFLF